MVGWSCMRCTGRLKSGVLSRIADVSHDFGNLLHSGGRAHIAPGLTFDTHTDPQGGTDALSL
jgi:hypothetical protein